MVVTGRVQDLILNPQETGRITEVIAEGEYYGMQTFDQALLDHVADGQHRRGDRARGRLEPARLQAHARRPGSAGERDRAGHGRRRRRPKTHFIRKALAILALRWGSRDQLHSSLPSGRK